MDVKEIIAKGDLVYEKTKVLTDKEMHYCPGCTHGTVHKAIAEVIEEMGIQEKTIGISPVGCSVFAYEYLHIDWQQAAHGRAPALATATKRLMPEKYVFTYQGDGDIASIGCAEAIHACNRGENILMIFINNGIYGMTGGQMAPTTLDGMKTATSPTGRTVEQNGYTLDLTKMIAPLPGVCYVARHSADTAAATRKLKRALKKGFENSMKNKGTSFVEVISTCNSGWKMSPVAANEWMRENMFPVFPLGTIKDE
ncbi:2-oxoglutarate ferredoxin oxidoreductase subunit beta [Balneicella halophila]|uniref:2-oxoglutarate ferredoxin oxidoreductase subunit beta n=1 Tax=Balneicella halophila TaxID=1537566 RepID=A0A7L4URD2_BALHA|nr:thiamine pyrophosphate-dependent enzyme [Balneicella halophila]PVX52001.1 2-oxoglutarate ferredoxin oxidoreductase subunit beta [Balneicella halophila]